MAAEKETPVFPQLTERMLVNEIKTHSQTYELGTGDNPNVWFEHFPSGAFTMTPEPGDFGDTLEKRRKVLSTIYYAWYQERHRSKVLDLKVKEGIATAISTESGTIPANQQGELERATMAMLQLGEMDVAWREAGPRWDNYKDLAIPTKDDDRFSANSIQFLETVFPGLTGYGFLLYKKLVSTPEDIATNPKWTIEAAAAEVDLNLENPASGTEEWKIKNAMELTGIPGKATRILGLQVFRNFGGATAANKERTLNGQKPLVGVISKDPWASVATPLGFQRNVLGRFYSGATARVCQYLDSNNSVEMPWNVFQKKVARELVTAPVYFSPPYAEGKDDENTINMTKTAERAAVLNEAVAKVMDPGGGKEFLGIVNPIANKYRLPSGAFDQTKQAERSNEYVDLFTLLYKVIQERKEQSPMSEEVRDGVEAILVRDFHCDFSKAGFKKIWNMHQAFSDMVKASQVRTPFIADMARATINLGAVVTIGKPIMSPPGRK